MEYVGEHLWAANLGRALVAFSFIFALLSTLGYYSKGEAWKTLGRFAFRVHAVALFSLIGLLFFIMGSHYFEFDYVWKHTSLDLPSRYLFSAFWEGQEGSFLLWMFWNGVLGWILTYTAKSFEGPVVGVFAAVQAFLVSMILGVYIGDYKIGASPFILIREIPENIGLPWTQFADYLQRFPNFMDGSGLNPLLQNYWMTIHPPTLFLGFSATLVPFSYAIAALLRKDYKTWINSALIWSFFTVGILGVGILMGGAWAYEALSFGGFWAWDPVENTSLVPWLTMAAGAHLLLIQRNRGGVMPSTLFLLIITFLLVLYSTFLTRSGVLGDSSVHAFVDLGLSGQLLLYLLFFTIGAIVLYLVRYKNIPKKQGDDGMDSREFWMFIGSLVLLISGLQITLSTSYPVFNKLFGPDGLITLYTENKVLQDPIEHYNAIQVPFAIIIALLIGAGQFLTYKRTSSAAFFKRQIGTFIATIALTLFSAWALDMWNPIYFTLLLASYYAVVANVDFWVRWAKGNWNIAGSSVAHVGFGLILAGALISNANKDIISQNDTFIHEEFPANENLLVELGDTVQMGEYWVSWKDQTEEGYYVNYNLEFFEEQEGALEHSFTLSPRIQMNERMGNVAEPSTKHYLGKDVYTHVTYADLRTNEERGNEEWKNQFDLEMGVGESHFLYGKYQVRLDTLVVEAPQTNGTPDYVVLGAGLSIKTMTDSTYKIMPLYAVQGNESTHRDIEIDELGLKFSFDRINYDTNKPVIVASEHTDAEVPFIIVKAEVFPWINMLWLGSIIMAIGTVIAMIQRRKQMRA
ncbi:MAG: hypothetical protein RL754_248 [Bacteroidota bacterium]|jgi:cytochrome c-type biogenesis protein CcmF